MNKNQLLFLDTETTGTGPEDRLCQVAYHFASEEHEAIFKPPVPISVDAMVVTHITNRMVADREPFLGSPLCTHLLRILADGNILVAHNAPFDIEMLRREGLAVKQSIDTFRLAHHLDVSGTVPKYSLQYLRYFFDLEVDDAAAHSALGDVRVLIALFDRYLEEMLVTLGSEEAVLQEMLAISSRPILMRKFNFGKYAGLEVKQVAHDDPGYLAWLFNQKIMARERGEENDEHWIYTLDWYVNA
jgi:DNA polymerase III epsilon subunit-like protein